MILGLGCFCIGSILGCRFLWYFFQGDGSGKVQSLLLVVLFLLTGVIAGMIAFVADLLAVNRMMLEDIQYTMRRAKLFDGEEK